MTKFALLFYITIKKAIVSCNESKPKSMLSCECARKWIPVHYSIYTRSKCSDVQLMHISDKQSKISNKIY